MRSLSALLGIFLPDVEEEGGENNVVHQSPPFSAVDLRVVVHCVRELRREQRPQEGPQHLEDDTSDALPQVQRVFKSLPRERVDVAEHRELGKTVDSVKGVEQREEEQVVGQHPFAGRGRDEV